MKVLHYLNQFFAGQGGEEAADSHPAYRDGPVGPGVRLNELLGDGSQIVGTLFAGDNYFSSKATDSSEVIEKFIKDSGADLLVAGPAFNAGRYGLACGEVCTLAMEQLDIPVLIAMSENNPATELHRSRIPILGTSDSINGMQDALKAMAEGISAYASSKGDWSDASSLLIARGVRLNEVSSVRGSTRAIDLLLAKIAGDSYATEWPLPDYDIVEPSELGTSKEQPLVALVTEGGLVPRGNPGGLNSGRADRWFSYSIADTDRLDSGEFEIIHGGIDTSSSNQNPNRMVPVDAAKGQESLGQFSLHGSVYSTTGNQGSIPEMRRIGDEIAAELHNAGVHAVIATST